MNAVSRLEEAFAEPPANELERDGCIQRFEYTYELCWKMMRRQLVLMEAEDADLLGRRELFREAARLGLITDPQSPLSIRRGGLGVRPQRARNLTSHNYDPDKAEETYQAALFFVPQARRLLNTLIDRHA